MTGRASCGAPQRKRASPENFRSTTMASFNVKQVYPVLTQAKTGLLGAIVGRSEAHVIRFACIFAALDSELCHHGRSSQRRSCGLGLLRAERAAHLRQPARQP